MVTNHIAVLYEQIIKITYAFLSETLLKVSLCQTLDISIKDKKKCNYHIFIFAIESFYTPISVLTLFEAGSRT